MKDYTDPSGGGALVCFLSGVLSRWWGGSGSISIPTFSYSQDVEFSPLFHTGKDGLATKAVIVIELQL
jgi:hypothetical protein